MDGTWGSEKGLDEELDGEGRVIRGKRVVAVLEGMEMVNAFGLAGESVG